jgi:hypothetical protein
MTDDDPPAGEQFPDGIGWLLHKLLSPEPQPGPPYVHRFGPPEPDGYDEHGDPIYWPKPTHTISALPTRTTQPNERTRKWQTPGSPATSSAAH